MPTLLSFVLTTISNALSLMFSWEWAYNKFNLNHSGLLEIGGETPMENWIEYNIFPNTVIISQMGAKIKNANIVIIYGNTTTILSCLKQSHVKDSTTAIISFAACYIIMITRKILKLKQVCSDFPSFSVSILWHLSRFHVRNNVILSNMLDNHDKNLCLFYHNHNDYRRPNFECYDHTKCKKVN